jgi:hypothetical protein
VGTFFLLRDAIASRALHGQLFAANNLVGWIGGLLEEIPAAQLWLLHAAFALIAGVIFLVAGASSVVSWRLATTRAEQRTNDIAARFAKMIFS